MSILQAYYYEIGAEVLFNWKDKWHKGKIINDYRTHEGIINIQLDSGLKVWCGEARHEEFVKQVK